MTSAIAINLVARELPDRTNYRKTSPNVRTEHSNALLSFSTHSQGRFSATGKGVGLSTGDVIYVSLKGSKTLSLPLTVDQVSYLIEPSDQWQAELSGEEFGSLNILTWQVKCDVCQESYPLEFVSRECDDSDAQVQHAESRLIALGWRKSESKHICPDCSELS